jgi:hypothetical protein
MNLRLGLIAASLSALTSGCLVTSDPGPPVIVADNGLLTLDWTVDGVADPDECDQSSSASIELLVMTRGGSVVGDYLEYCDEFVMSVELSPGSYYAEAALLDARDVARTTSVSLGDFEIFGNDELFVSVDFPASSFY